jgi:hypothetical protein
LAASAISLHTANYIAKAQQIKRLTAKLAVIEDKVFA